MSHDGKSRAPDTSRAAEDYLKAIYKLQQVQDSVATTSLAEELGRSAASVTNMVKSLAEQGLLEYTPYRGVRLTSSGELTALRIIRRHRVLELYLIEKLGFSWDNVHREAERLEHAASDKLIDRMARKLGEPSVDPHGSPIPTRDGEIADTRWIALAALQDGGRGVVREVSDESDQTLRQLAVLGLFPGTRIRILGGLPEGGVQLVVDDREIDLEADLARAIFVEHEE